MSKYDNKNVNFNVRAPDILNPQPEIVYAKNNKVSARIIYLGAQSINQYTQQVEEQQKVLKLMQCTQGQVSTKPLKITELNNSCIGTQSQIQLSQYIKNIENSNKETLVSEHEIKGNTRSLSQNKINQIDDKQDQPFFVAYPEALHKPDLNQCKRYNSDLMIKLVNEKHKKGSRFKNSKLMDDVFKFRVGIDKPAVDEQDLLLNV